MNHINRISNTNTNKDCFNSNVKRHKDKTDPFACSTGKIFFYRRGGVRLASGRWGVWIQPRWTLVIKTGSDSSTAIPLTTGVSVSGPRRWPLCKRMFPCHSRYIWHEKEPSLFNGHYCQIHSPIMGIETFFSRTKNPKHAKAQPLVFAVGDGNKSCCLTGLW